MTMFLSKVATTAQDGLWFCYELQVWIRHGVILRCGHRQLHKGCNGCTMGGTEHAVCEDCH